MRQTYADFDESRNRVLVQAFYKVMNAELPIATGTNGSMSFIADRTDLPPSQAGLAAALRRAFKMPADESARKFDELLSKIH